MAPRLVRTSERGDFKECPWKWYHSWILGLTTRRVPTWSWFGTAWHKAMEARYPIGRKRGSLADMIDAFKESVGNEQRRIWTEGGELDEEEVVDGLELGIAMLKAYVAWYGNDQHWQVLHTEQPFQIDVVHPETGRLLCVYCGTWDMFVWDLADKAYRLVDHKTRKAFKTDWSFYDLNDQGGSYLWVGKEVLVHKGIITQKDVIDGIVFNMAKKTMPDTRLTNSRGQALNKDGTVSAKQPALAFDRYTTYRTDGERVRQARKVIDESRMMNGVRSGKLPMLKHATEDCVRCQFFEMCQLDEKDPAEAREYARSMLVTRDPYADHRVAMEASGIQL